MYFVIITDIVKILSIKNLIKAIYLFFLLGFSSCSSGLNQDLSKFGANFWIKKYPEEKTEISPISQNNLEEDLPEEKLTSIELMWLVPQGRITKYILRYGISSDNLHESIEIPVKNLTPIMHPKLGKVYKYILNGVPKTRIFYTLQAGNEFGLSDPTPVGFEKPID
jgi:hypothetical protein